MEFYYNLINYLFPVFIYKGSDVLTIEDRRPSFKQLILVGSGIGLVFLSALAWRSFYEDGLFGLILVFILVALLLVIKALFEPFWGIYVFDKRVDTYTFVRKSLIRGETEQGSLSQFRAVQIERRLISTDDGTAENYYVALLKNGGLLLGSPSEAILREGNSPPIFSDFSSESRIAEAIADFLNFPPAEVVDVWTKH